MPVTTLSSFPDTEISLHNALESVVHCSKHSRGGGNLSHVLDLLWGVMGRCFGSVQHVRTAAQMSYCHYSIACFYHSYVEKMGSSEHQNLMLFYSQIPPHHGEQQIAGCTHIFLKSTEVKDKLLGSQGSYDCLSWPKRTTHLNRTMVGICNMKDLVSAYLLNV